MREPAVCGCRRSGGVSRTVLGGEGKSLRGPDRERPALDRFARQSCGNVLVMTTLVMVRQSRL